MMRVEVETDLMLSIPPPMLSIPLMEEKEVKSTESGEKERLNGLIVMHRWRTWRSLS